MKFLLAALLSVAALAVVAGQSAQTPQTSQTAPTSQTPPTPQTPQPAQTPEPVQGPTFRTGVDLVASDVAVVDRNGRPVEDLRAPDFAVKIDGEVRRVVSAELIKVDVEAAKRQVADKSETFYTSNLTPPNGRQIIIAVDQISYTHLTLPTS